MSFRFFAIKKHAGSLVAMIAVFQTVLAGCSSHSSDEPTSTDRKPLSVAVVNYPLCYFAKRIGGEHIDVKFPIPPDTDPAHWNPGGDEVAPFQNADLILINGAGYAGWLKTATLPSSKMVNTSISFEDQYIVAENAIVHSHGPGDSHSHSGIAFTTWLDPTLAIEQANAVRAAILEKRPDLKESLDANFKTLLSDLQKIEDRFRSATMGPKKPLFFSHPVYQYLIRRYALDAKELHWEPEQYPSAPSRKQFLRMRENHLAEWILWEGEPLAESVEWLESNGVRSTVFDPCGNVPDSGDYLSVMLENADRLALAFE